jgi:hypothetical protein
MFLFHVFLVFPCVVKVNPGRNQWKCWYVMSSVESNPSGNWSFRVKSEIHPLPMQYSMVFHVFLVFPCVVEVKLGWN